MEESDEDFVFDEDFEEEENYLNIKQALTRKSESPSKIYYSWQPVSNGHDLETCEALMSGFVYSGTLGRKGRGSKISKCAVHVNCNYFRRMQLDDTSTPWSQSRAREDQEREKRPC